MENEREEKEKAGPFGCLETPKTIEHKKTQKNTKYSPAGTPNPGYTNLLEPMFCI
jgi:hypothetical protein